MKLLLKEVFGKTQEKSFQTASVFPTQDYCLKAIFKRPKEIANYKNIFLLSRKSPLSDFLLEGEHQRLVQFCKITHTICFRPQIAIVWFDLLFYFIGNTTALFKRLVKYSTTILK